MESKSKVQPAKTASNLDSNNNHTNQKPTTKELATLALRCQQILGVNTSSSLDDLKLAFKKKALLFHPERNKSEEAKIKFQVRTTQPPLCTIHENDIYSSCFLIDLRYCGESKKINVWKSMQLAWN
jgi:hypothetical protein